MIKRTTLMLTLLATTSVLAAIPANYYKDANGLSGFKLKTALSKIISAQHRDRGYSALYNYYQFSDIDKHYDGDGTLVDIYSEDPSYKDTYNFSATRNKCGAYKKEADCFNREHLFPQGIFKKASPMRSDFFHVFPTDGYVNNRRGSLPFGEVGQTKWTSRNGSKRGMNTTPGYRGEVFEPIDEFKGDVARALLYFAVRYERRVSSWHHKMLNGTKDQVYKTWFVNLLLKWHKQDPPSKHELNRNEHGYKFQGNRNPFIDNPQLVERIWN